MSPVYKFSNVGGFLTKNLYTSALAGNPAVILDKGSMYPLGVFTLSSAQANVEFTNIPQTYTHLQIRLIGRTSEASAQNFYFRFNGETTATNYRWHYLEGNGTAASSGTGTSVGGLIGVLSADTNIFTGSIVDILDYKNTNKNKTVRTSSGFDRNGSNTWLQLNSALWTQTSAITSITILATTGNIAANSSFALYGIQA